LKLRMTLAVPLALTFVALPSSSGDRSWSNAKVVEIQRTLEAEKRDHWEYVLASDIWTYRLWNASNDPPYLNSSLGAQVKIASATGSDKPFDGDSVYVLDAQGARTQDGISKRRECC